MTEYEERLERIRKYAEEAAKAPLIRRGWVCRDPDVKAVWFVGYMSAKLPAAARMKLEILFNNGAHHSIDQREVDSMEGDIEELLVMKGDEYLRGGGKGVLPINIDEPETTEL